MPIVLIFDCGATNLRTIAMSNKGEILAACHIANNTQPDIKFADYHIWNFEEIWQKLSDCADQTIDKLRRQNIDLKDIVGISVTTFGVDGAPFDRYGQQLYPIISWKCPRTLSVMEKLDKLLDVKALYQRNGIGQYSFNTLFKLLWLKEHEPEVFQKMDKFVFISSMLTQRLTGEWTTDHTMAGTSMMTNLVTGDWDEGVLRLLGLTSNHFPPMRRAGEKVGDLTTALAMRWGLNCIPVIACGHDTQFAVFGSGAGLNQPVLSSGTWEILMARTQYAQPQFDFISQGLTTEFDVQPNCFNPAVQWVGSGIMEWLGKLLFADVYGTNKYYSTMIAEAMEVGERSIKSAVDFQGVFSQIGQGHLVGLSMFTSRSEIYRAALYYMAKQLKQGLVVLQQVSHFKAESLICVGGGSKNPLWNQIRADVLGLPIDVVDVAETTVLGAAMFTFVGVGVYDNAETAQKIMQPQRKRIYPQFNFANE
ncbi:L-fuculokinase [Rodentibacter pneumotropicus]|uniref:L-fuculokinase n=1 Tax=Rodentibacter pneumotropicus TaxID=758 RepID=A0AAW5LDZ5_9PAST|nr:L-fuculokinase [Rodentibacter pneumotropicus]MCQ9121787.1 L-fuculokinase [Rodentibacter pneumotropicus]OOF68675.1 L-fuculokinase [Rodentibacter pneumotropicus]